MMEGFKVARLHDAARIPVRASLGDAGLDLSSVADLVIPARGQGLVPTGLAFQIPEDCYGRVAPRSGLAVKNGISVGAGVVDSGYRGEVKVVLFNHSDNDFKVQIGDRIAQIIIERIYTGNPKETTYNDLQQTDRGADGFGSSGVKEVKKK